MPDARPANDISAQGDAGLSSTCVVLRCVLLPVYGLWKRPVSARKRIGSAC
ncbi:hypothetical protein C7S14_0946 [Burkholderia cepacia]|nr:hypothetical protein C7S14_0946 [Burkholderia cepacia]